MSEFDKKILILISYFAILICLLFLERSFELILLLHLIFVIIFSTFYFKEKFIEILFAPFLIIINPLSYFFLKKLLTSNFNQNSFEEAVIILSGPNFKKAKSWLSPSFFGDEIWSITQYLKAKDVNFSIFTNPKKEDIKKIMKNKKVREVFFVGHGTSYSFEFSTDEDIHYSSFDDRDKYQKDYIHQIHCGTPEGKSLVDYLVVDENKEDCFFFRRTIRNNDIRNRLEEMTKNHTGRDIKLNFLEFLKDILIK